MTTIITNDISFSGLKALYLTNGTEGADNHDELTDDSTSSAISLSYFRNTEFTDDTSISSSEPIAIGSKFRSKTFASSAVYEFAILNVGTHAIAGALSSTIPIASGYAHTSQQSTDIDWSALSTGFRIQFLVSGKVVALGAQNIHGGKMALYPDASDTLASEIIDILGTNTTDVAPNYHYTTLTTPVSVSANSIYWTSLKNTTGGHSFHNFGSYASTNTSSGNMKVISSGYFSTSAESTIPDRPTVTNTTWSYGATDLIFLPD